ncbi:hypothetical protein ACFLWR_00565 [Chloroflexota bacterium]
MLNVIIENFKQWVLYPQEFRIAFPNKLELSESFGELDASKGLNPIKLQSNYKNEEELLDMATDVGTLVWRVQKRLSTIEQLPKELKRVSSDLESTWTALIQRGIEIKDHTGQDYVSGMALKVITSQVVPGLTKRQIMETIKPTIYYKEKIMQMGEVIIGVPQNNESSKSGEKGLIEE